MTYKKDCNFRIKLNACKFKPEDCNKKTCDFYSLRWNWIHLLKKIKQEQNLVRRLKNKPDKKDLIRDKEYGIAYMGQAICEITGFNPTHDQVRELRKSIKK